MPIATCFSCKSIYNNYVNNNLGTIFTHGGAFLNSYQEVFLLKKGGLCTMLIYTKVRNQSVMIKWQELLMFLVWIRKI